MYTKVLLEASKANKIPYDNYKDEGDTETVGGIHNIPC